MIWMTCESLKCLRTSSAVQVSCKGGMHPRHAGDLTKSLSFVRLEYGKVKQGSARAEYDCRPAKIRDVDGNLEAKKFQSKLRVHPKLVSCCFLRLLPSTKEQESVPILLTSAINNKRADVKSVRDMVKELTKLAELSEEEASPEVRAQKLVNTTALLPQQ